MGDELQKQIKIFTERDEEHKKLLEKKTDEVQQLKQELKDLQSQTEEKDKCYNEAEAQRQSLEKLKVELENSIQEMKKEREVTICSSYSFVKKKKSTLYD